jgi:hypothetical protein
MVVSAVHPSNIWLPIDISPAGRTTDVNDVQLKKRLELFCKTVNVDGIRTAVIPDPANALLSKLLRLGGRGSDVSAVHPLKLLMPMLTIVDGNTTEESDVHP